MALVKFGKFSGIFVDFWRVYSGLGPNYKYFSETEDPAKIFTNIWEPWQNKQQVQGAQCKIHGVYQISKYFFNRKNLWTGSTVRWTGGAAGSMLDRVGGASPAQGVSGAMGLRRSLARVGDEEDDEVKPVMAHWSLRCVGEVAWQWGRMAVPWARRERGKKQEAQDWGEMV
jgi:hypothetical protein